jgi:hypothetical protein
VYVVLFFAQPEIRSAAIKKEGRNFMGFIFAKAVSNAVP